MTNRALILAGALTAIAGGTAYAAGPKALDGVSGGLWELTGVPGSKAPVRQ